MEILSGAAAHVLHVARGPQRPYSEKMKNPKFWKNNKSENRSEGFPRTGYFIPGRDGTGAWRISGVVRVTARACFVCVFEVFAGDARGRWGRARALGTRAGVIVS